MAGFAESAARVGFASHEQPSHGFASMAAAGKSLGSLAPQVGFGADLKRYEHRHTKGRPAKPVREIRQKRQEVAAQRTEAARRQKGRTAKQSVRPSRSQRVRSAA